MKRVIKIFRFILVLLLIFGWVFNYPPINFGGQGWPRIWQNPKIPPKVQEARAAELSTLLLLTAVLTFVILKLVNPPRAYLGRCGVCFVLK